MNRNKAFGRYDQDAMYFAIMYYLYYYDPQFKLKYLSMDDKEFQFTKCMEYCQAVPVYHGCVSRCFANIGLLRNNMEQITNNISVFWTPRVEISWSYFTQYDKTGLNVYPFSLNLNWAQPAGMAGLFIDTDLEEVQLFETLIAKWTNLFDEVYVLHYRHNHLMRDKMYQSVLDMKVLRL